MSKVGLQACSPETEINHSPEVKDGDTDLGHTSLPFRNLLSGKKQCERWLHLRSGQEVS